MIGMAYLFATQEYDAKGGAFDCIGTFPDAGEAKRYADALAAMMNCDQYFDCWHIAVSARDGLRVEWVGRSVPDDGMNCPKRIEWEARSTC